MKYLKLNFRNAGFFTVHKDTKDFVFDLNGQRKRKEVFYGKQQKVSISVNQISNMLHVLMGERPSATYRDTFIDKIDDIFEIANKSYIKIDSPTFINNSKNTKYYQSESITIRKAIYNSYSTAPDLVYWKRVENFLTDDEDNSLFFETLKVLSNVLGYDVTSKTAMDVFDELRTNHLENQEIFELKKILKSKGKTPIIKLLEGGYTGGFTMNSNSRTLLTTNFGVDKVTRLSGSIVVPLEDNYIEKIRKSKGIAKILDGGFVWIDDLLNEYEFGIDELNEYIIINKLEEYENNN
jgi:hypothetical protein